MTLADYMVDEIAVTPFTGDDDVDQTPSYGARVVYRARVEEGLVERRTSAGTVVEQVTVVATEASVSDRDRVWVAPFAGNNLPRTFPVGFVFVDADARSPRSVTNARRMAGGGGHVEFRL